MVRDIGFTSDGIDHFPREYAAYENKWFELVRPGVQGSSGKIVNADQGYFSLLPYVSSGREGYQLIHEGDPEKVPIAGTGIIPSSEDKILRDITAASERNLRKQRIEDLEERQKLSYLENIAGNSKQLKFEF